MGEEEEKDFDVSVTFKYSYRMLQRFDHLCGDLDRTRSYLIRQACDEFWIREIGKQNKKMKLALKKLGSLEKRREAAKLTQKIVR